MSAQKPVRKVFYSNSEDHFISQLFTSTETLSQTSVEQLHVLPFWSAGTATLLTAEASLLFADEGTEATAENDKKPRVGLPVQKEEEGVPTEPGSPAQGGPAGERASAEGEPGPEAETGWERGETESVSAREPPPGPPRWCLVSLGSLRLSTQYCKFWEDQEVKCRFCCRSFKMEGKMSNHVSLGSPEG